MSHHSFLDCYFSGWERSNQSHYGVCVYGRYCSYSQLVPVSQQSMFEMLMVALTLPWGLNRHIYEAVCLELVWSSLWPAAGIKLTACFGLHRTVVFSHPLQSCQTSFWQAGMVTICSITACAKAHGRKIFRLPAICVHVTARLKRKKINRFISLCDYN